MGLTDLNDSTLSHLGDSACHFYLVEGCSLIAGPAGCSPAFLFSPRSKHALKQSSWAHGRRVSTPYSQFQVFGSRLTTRIPANGASTTSLGRSPSTIGPFTGPTLPTATSIPTATTATDRAAQASSAASSSSTTPGTLGGVSESPDNATTSSNADHGSCHRTSEEYYTTSSGPFCQPKNLQDVWAGRTYSAIWEYVLSSPSCSLLSSYVSAFHTSSLESSPQET